MPCGLACRGMMPGTAAQRHDNENIFYSLKKALLYERKFLGIIDIELWLAECGRRHDHEYAAAGAVRSLFNLAGACEAGRCREAERLALHLPASQPANGGCLTSASNRLKVIPADRVAGESYRGNGPDIPTMTPMTHSGATMM